MITHLDLAELSRAPAPFNRPGWLFEIKYDGFRMCAMHRGRNAKLVSRGGKHFAECFPEVAADLLELPEVVLDGELVILDRHGRSQFERLSRRARLKRRISIEHAARREPASLFAFDILELDGRDLRSRPLRDRKALLEASLAGSKRIRYTDHVEGQGVTLFKLAEGLELEGIVGKRADAPYPRGGCSTDWVQIKTVHSRRVDEEHGMRNKR